jgi:hypothetical protein
MDKAGKLPYAPYCAAHFPRFFARMEIPKPTGTRAFWRGRFWKENAGRCSAVYLNSKLNTEMTATNDNRFYKDPTHDEIALNAFLAWERDGCPQSADSKYWFDAEARLRAQRQKQAQTAAALAARPWPPHSRAARARQDKTEESATPKTAPLTTTVERTTAVKMTRAAKSNAPRVTGRALNSMRAR